MLSVAPLQTTVYFKASHTCTYIPWRANVPQHIRTAWVRGVCVRYLRLCSAESYFELCCAGLIQALQYWGYRANFRKPLPLRWADRHRFLVLKPKLRARGPVHAFRVHFHKYIPVSFSKVSHTINLGLSHLI